MHSMTSSTNSASNISKPALFALGMAVLIGTWAVLWWWESMFTESHLVGYYCCVSEGDLPALGTLERTLSDSFRASPGKHLPPLVFLAVSVPIFAFGVQRAQNEYWLLPFLFVIFNILYLVTSLALVDLSWSLSSALVGPRTGVYAGYHRTWYGIAMHLVLWGVFFRALSQVPLKLIEKVRVYRATSDV
jgi:hypothetical protein